MQYKREIRRIMTKEEKRSIFYLCEICKESPASEIKGGIYNNTTDMWMVCKACKDKITDRRLKR